MAPVDIDGRIWFGLWQLKVLAQRFARYIGKRRQQRYAVPRAAPGAKIHLSVAREDHLRMRFAVQDSANDLDRGLAHALSPMNQP